MTDANEALTPLQNLGFLVSAIRCGQEFDEHCQRAADALRAHLSDPGYVRVSVEVNTDAMLYGRGFFVLNADGSTRRVPPEEIMLAAAQETSHD